MSQKISYRFAGFVKRYELSVLQLHKNYNNSEFLKVLAIECGLWSFRSNYINYVISMVNIQNISKLKHVIPKNSLL